MSLRLGVTVREEFHMRQAIAAGKSWSEIRAELQDVDPEYVFETIYKPLAEQAKAGEDITITPQPGDMPKPSGASDGPPPGDIDPAKPAPEGTKKL